MWISIDKISWNSDVVLAFTRDEAIAYEPYQNHYRHIEDEAQRKAAIGQVYDVIELQVNGPKKEIQVENISDESTEK